MTAIEKNRVNARAFRKSKTDLGWVCFYRIVPKDLANILQRIIVEHRASNYDLWQSAKKGN
jgi:hypothetical protein